MEALALHTGVPTVHWEDNTSYISVFDAKRVTPSVKHIDILVYFLQEKFENGLFLPKYENFSVMPEDECTKPYLGPIIRLSTKWITGFGFYPNSEKEHYQLTR